MGFRLGKAPLRCFIDGKKDKMANESAFRVFEDKGQHQKDHATFRRWQRDNPRGYVLNFRVGNPPMLHRSLCPT
jgi:hypothetical protein